MARLYANENFPLPVVEELIRLGHDVLTTIAAGNAGRAIPDEQVLGFAVQDKRALLTLNRRHFLRLVRDGAPHAGLIACTFDPDFLRQAASIDAAIAQRRGLDGQILRINRPS
jgi:hypothetical protein